MASPRDPAVQTERLRSTLGKMELVLGAINEAIVWTGADLRVQWCNATFDRLVGLDHLGVLGRPLPELLPLTRDGRPVPSGLFPLTLLQQTHGAPMMGGFDFAGPEGARHLEIHAAALSPGQGEYCAVAVIRDVTDRRDAEAALAQETRRIDLLRTIADAANDAETPEAALRIVLGSIGQETGWDLGHAYLVSRDPEPILVSCGLWHGDSWDRFAHFAEVSEAAQFRPGFGLPGRVWSSGQPEWIEEIGADANFPRREAAVACGIVSAFAFPIRVGREVTAVLEFFSTARRMVDESLLRVAAQAGTHLGRAVERQRAQYALMRAKRELEARVEERTEKLRREMAERERAETVVREAFNRYHSLLRSVRDIVFSVGPRGQIESANEAFGAITGHALADWIGKPFARLIHREDRALARERFSTLRGGGDPPPFELRVRTADGRWVILECSMSPRMKDGALKSAFGIARDVTGRRKAAEELLLRDRAMASTTEGIVITDATLPGNPVVYVNGGFERLTGYPSAEVLGRTCSFLQGPATSPQAVSELREAIAAQRECAVDLENYRKDGQPFWNRLSITPVRDGAGRLTHFIGVQSDVTARKKAAQLKNDLIATVSHELRTPLTSLRGFAELMLAREYPADRRREFLAIIHKEAIRLTSLINDFLDIQRIESGRQEYRFESLPVGVLINETAALFREGAAAHRIETAVESGLPPVRADADRIRQVLANLTSNAIKFSPAGGLIQLAARLDGESVLCSVRDEGLGIPANEIPKLFEKFHRVDNTETRKIGGTGLGLALVKQIVGAHGGSVSVESEPGKGSTFRFTVPVA